MSDEPVQEFLNIKEQYDKFIDENIVIDDNNIGELSNFLLPYTLMISKFTSKHTATRHKMETMKNKEVNGTLAEEDMQTLANMAKVYDDDEQKIKEMNNTLIKFLQMTYEYYYRRVAQARRGNAENSNNPEAA